jgi:hypothetical protein
MARTHARILASVWTDEDWRALTRDGQWAYVLLVSQPQINNCGVLHLALKRWVRLARGMKIDDVKHALAELEYAHFVVCDNETDEILVRSFIKHDRIERQPNLVTAAKRQFHEIESHRIRVALQHYYPHLFGDPREPLPEPLFELLPEGVPEPLSNGLDKPTTAASAEPLPEGLTEGVPADARADAGARPLPLPQPSTPSPTPGEGPTSSSIPRAHDDAAVDDDDEAEIPGDLLLELVALRPSRSQRERWLDAARTEPDRVQACLAAAKANGQNPAAYLDDLIADDAWPTEERPAGVLDLDALSRRWRNLILGHGWDEDTRQETIREELTEIATNAGYTDPIDEPLERALEAWRTERAKRYPGVAA